jgi:hypothetical protein
MKICENEHATHVSFCYLQQAVKLIDACDQIHLHVIAQMVPGKRKSQAFLLGS